MTTYGYIRVSTAEQAADNRSSLENQKRRVSGVALIHGMTDVKIITDAGVSGALDMADRPAGGALYRKLMKGDTLIVDKLDRLFRSARDAVDTAAALSKRGVNLIISDISTEPLTEEGPGKFFFTLMAAVLEFERTRMLECLETGRKAKKAKGGHTGGQAPYGFRVEGLGRDAVLVEDPGEQVVLSRAKALYASGASLRGVVQALAREGFVSRSGTPFQATQIMRMVK